MFKLQGLLSKVPCPDSPQCKRKPCCFSHDPVPVPKRPAASVVPQKRPVPPTTAFHAPKIARTDASSSKIFAPPHTTGSAIAKNKGPTKDSVPTASTSRAPAAVELKLKDYTMASRVQVPLLNSFKRCRARYRPYTNRMQVLKLFYEQYTNLYSELPSNPTELARRDAVQQEYNAYASSTKATYKGLAAQALTKLKKRTKASATTGIGTNEELQQSHDRAVSKAKSQLKPQQLKRYTLEKYDKERWEKDFIMQVPVSAVGSDTESGHVRACSRCGLNFMVKDQLEQGDQEQCLHHWGRKATFMIDGKKNRLFNCCQDLAPCSRGPHVFQDKDPAVLHARAPFVTTASISATASPVPVCALDCEMIYTTAGLSLARITIINGDGEAIMDEFISPHPAAVIDCNTRFSGIAKDQMKTKAVLDMGGLHRALGSILHPQTLLIGHGIDNDLRAMRLIHPPESIIDTSMVFIHPRGPTMRYSLRNLCMMHLKKFIQDEGFHDSKQDAQMTLDLLRFKIQEDERLGVHPTA